MSAAMAVRSGEILQAYDLTSVYLHRWQRDGLLRAIEPARPGGKPALWPDWTWRIVALIRRCGYDGRATVATAARSPLDVLRIVAETLAIWPDVPWVAITDDGIGMPCYEASEAVAIHRHQICTTIVAVPSLEEASTP